MHTAENLVLLLYAKLTTQFIVAQIGGDVNQQNINIF